MPTREVRRVVGAVAAVVAVQGAVALLVALRSGFLLDDTPIPRQIATCVVVAAWLLLAVGVPALVVVLHRRDEREWPGAVHVRESWRLQSAHVPGAVAWVGGVVLLLLWLLLQGPSRWSSAAPLPWVDVLHAVALWIGPALTIAALPTSLDARRRARAAGSLGYDDVPD